MENRIVGIREKRWAVIVYWIATVFTAANYLFGGVIYIMRTPDVVAGMTQLGYPVYITSILGFWKLLGGTAVLLPRQAMLKEWAYAGIFFNLTGAAASNAFAGNEVHTIVGPIVGLIVAAVSYVLRPASRTWIGRLAPSPK